MEKFKLLVLCIIIAGFFWSCDKDEVANEIPEHVTLKPTKAQLDKLSAMFINTDNVVIKDITTLDGIKKKYLVSGDILIPVLDLKNYSKLKPKTTNQKQFRFPHIVSPPYRVIDILGYTGSGYALTSKMQTGLRWAVNNYNSLGNSLRFRLTFGTDFSSADMVVYNNNQPGGGGAASTPNPAGRPGKYIQINAGTNSFSTNVVEHVMTHEIGHAIGLAHQDWYNLQSCGYTGPVPAGPAPIWIPGTPWSPYTDSVMLACFSASADGELTATDILALNILY
ncbi:hypothetical protein IWQ47_004571 [Aquimarina sp. EL_43]|uniref:M57 family metalloprotease n=1 Tax=Aquimarina TaxID=290174 RepID=UPI00046F4D59|nr:MULTISPECIES: M57 family metalloprotease [Aquimarina]MBG6133095.1 hypothetical protein [Aquimarina sp. EL_35]MBG6153253.1 hypothetical protein [Aquimarina sp. EL_32]MBG6171478.1 hypothetical protein [Aquimarina sp. EL_43]